MYLFRTGCPTTCDHLLQFCTSGSFLLMCSTDPALCLHCPSPSEVPTNWEADRPLCRVLFCERLDQKVAHPLGLGCLVGGLQSHSGLLGRPKMTPNSSGTCGPAGGEFHSVQNTWSYALLASLALVPRSMALSAKFDCEPSVARQLQTM